MSKNLVDILIIIRKIIAHIDLKIWILLDIKYIFIFRLNLKLKLNILL